MTTIPFATLVAGIIRNQSKRLGITGLVKRVLRKKERGGVDWSAHSAAENLEHAREIFGLLSPFIGPVTGKAGIEIGPGDTLGVAYHFLAAGAAEMIAVEKFSSVSELLNREIVRQMPPIDTSKATCLLGNFEEMELPRVDFIYSNDVLEHIADPRAFFARCASLLREGGVAVHNVDLAGHNIFRDLEHLTCPDALYRALFSHLETSNRVRLHEFIDAAKAAGLSVQHEVIKAAPLAYIAEIRPRLLPRYREIATPDLAALQAIIVCRR